MLRLFFTFVLQVSLVTIVQSQSFSVDDLLTLSSLSPKKFDSYMKEKGFMAGGRTMLNEAMALTFLGKNKFNPEDSIIHSRTVNLYKTNNTYCFAYHTSSLEEYVEGKKRLRRSDFFFAENKDTSLDVPMLFQQKNITVETNTSVEEGIKIYTFLLKKRELPNITRFAEDLLKFDSHEYLLSYFGEENVKKDIYYFSEKDMKKCSVLFGNSNKQVVFIWKDEENLSELSYILISGIMPTENGLPFNDNIGRNKWAFKTGIFSGMSIRELLELNERDFNFYGIDSEFSMMIEPKSTGRLNFAKIGIMLSCLDGTGSPLLKKQKISAEEAVDNRLAIHVSYIMLTP
jgi:hypothetical protein